MDLREKINFRDEGSHSSDYKDDCGNNLDKGLDCVYQSQSDTSDDELSEPHHEKKEEPEAMHI